MAQVLTQTETPNSGIQPLGTAYYTSLASPAQITHTPAQTLTTSSYGQTQTPITRLLLPHEAPFVLNVEVILVFQKSLQQLIASTLSRARVSCPFQQVTERQRRPWSGATIKSQAFLLTDLTSRSSRNTIAIWERMAHVVQQHMPNISPTQSSITLTRASMISL